MALARRWPTVSLVEIVSSLIPSPLGTKQDVTRRCGKGASPVCRALISPVPAKLHGENISGVEARGRARIEKNVAEGRARDDGAGAKIK